MGCSSGCRTFETLSSALEWIARKKMKIDHIIHLLDDFLIIAPSQMLCKGQLHLFLDLCSYLGIPIAPEKTITLSFADIELDSVSFEVCLPQEKLEKCVATISDFLTCKKVTLKEVQSLTGLLNFACSVVVPGRAFLRHLIDLTIGIRFPHHFIRLTKEVKLDLQLWQSFLSNFNGRTFFLEDTWSSSDKLQLYTDAAGALGFLCICSLRTGTRNIFAFEIQPSTFVASNLSTCLEAFSSVFACYISWCFNKFSNFPFNFSPFYCLHV